MFRNQIVQNLEIYSKLILYVDGGCEPKNPGGVATSGWVIYEKDESKPLVEHGAVVQDGGVYATNNFGEYYALCLALKWLSDNNWRGELCIRADSKLLVEQVSGRWKVNAEHLKVLRQKIWDYLDCLNLCIVDQVNPFVLEQHYPCYLTWIKRDKNQYANDLCRLAYKEFKDGKVQITSICEKEQRWL